MTSARARRTPAVVTAALVWSVVTVAGAPAAHAATSTPRPIAPASTADGSGGPDSDFGCGTANPCGGGMVLPRPGVGGSSIVAANRQLDSSPDESSASGLIGWLLDLVGVTGRRGGPGTASVATGSTDPFEADSGHGPARRPRVAATPVTATGNPVASATRAARPSRQPALEMPAPDLSVKPARRSADIPAQVVLSPPKRIEPAPSEVLPDAGTGRSRPGLSEQWSAARAEAKQRSGGSAGSAGQSAGQSSQESARQAASGTTRQATSESSSSPSGESSSSAASESSSPESTEAARQAAGGSSLRASSDVKSSSARRNSAGAPGEVATTAGGGASSFLNAIVTLASNAVTAIAGPAAGQHTHDMLSGVIHPAESAPATGERANSPGSHAEKTPR